MDFLDIVWFIFIWSLFVGYLIVLWKVISDLFGDHTLGGVAKAAWVLTLVVFPLLAVLVYLVARGGGMTDRELARNYASGGPSRSSAQEIAEAKRLLDQGAVSQAEFERLKAGAFMNPGV